MPGNGKYIFFGRHYTEEMFGKNIIFMFISLFCKIGSVFWFHLPLNDSLKYNLATQRSTASALEPTVSVWENLLKVSLFVQTFDKLIDHETERVNHNCESMVIKRVIRDKPFPQFHAVQNTHDDEDERCCWRDVVEWTRKLIFWNFFNGMLIMYPIWIIFHSKTRNWLEFTLQLQKFKYTYTFSLFHNLLSASKCWLSAET